jgi:predicted aminopeptidase
MKRGLALTLAGTAVAAALAGGCSPIQYYAQAIGGHFAVMSASRPIDEHLQSSEATPQLKARLLRVLAMREFASKSLGLPDNGSYRFYADIKRPYVVWNVFAAEEFSIKPKESCFPIVGCVAYRGFYGEEAAKAHGEQFRHNGLDVFVYGVTAYSTLGWFDDPVLNTFVGSSETELARIIFHELAHQVVYTRGDTVFNESFAVAVEEEGVRRWLAAEGREKELTAYHAARKRREDFVALVGRYQKLLGDAYAAATPAETKRADKTRLFAAMRADYEQMKTQAWGGFAGYDRWFTQDLNNAHLASVATYGDLVPAFQALLAKVGGDLPAFYREVKALAALPRAERHARLGALAPAVAAGEKANAVR